MKIDRLVLHCGIAETRAAALAGGLPVALFAESWLEPPRARLGEVHEARLRSQDTGAGGAFLDLDTGEEVFLRTRLPAGTGNGSTVTVRIAAEAHDDKCARAVLVRDGAPAPVALDAWRGRLPGTDRLEWQTGRDEIDAAFDEALAARVTLPGGGRLHIARTPALTAIDIDTAGRKMTGNAADRAHSINLVAAREAARQLSLRSLGGLAGIDCIAPIPRPVGNQLKSAFLATFRSICARKAEALAPSPFGLMEARLAWGERPVDALYAGAMGQLLSGLGALEREAEARPASDLALRLPQPAFTHLGERRSAVLEALARRYGARLTIEASARKTAEIETR